MIHLSPVESSILFMGSRPQGPVGAAELRFLRENEDMIWEMAEAGLIDVYSSAEGIIRVTTAHKGCELFASLANDQKYNSFRVSESLIMEAVI